MKTSKPIAKFSAGQVSCALWENEIKVNGKPTSILKATISRRYKDSGGNWQTSDSLSRNDIPLAVYCLQKGFAAMIEGINVQDIDKAIEEQRVI